MAKDQIITRLEGSRETKMILNKYGLSFDKRFARRVFGAGARIAVKAAKQATVKGSTGNLKRSIRAKFSNKGRYPVFGGWVGAKFRIAPHQWLYAYGNYGSAPDGGEGEWIPEAAAEVSGQINTKMLSETIKHARVAERQVARLGMRQFKRNFGFGFKK